MLIKDICSTITEGSHNPPKGIKSSSYLMLSSKNVLDDKITLDEPRFLSKEDFEKENKRTDVKCDDVLLTIVGTVGRAAVVSNDLPPFALQRSVAVLHPDENVCSGRYLMYALRGKRSYIERHSKGVAQKEIYLKEVAEIDLPVPSKEIQGQIIEKLDKVNSVIKCRQLELEKFDDLIKARFVEMFGDPVINSKNLELSTLANLGMLGRGRSKHRPRNDPKLLGGKYPLIQTGEISQSGLYIRNFSNTYSELGLKQSKLWPKDTLCITIAANIASTSILTFNACFPDSVVGFISNEDKVKPVFLHYWFSFFQNIIESQATQVAQKNINLKVLSNLSVIHPPLSLQNEFADFVRQVDKSKVAVQKSLDETQKLFNSLMQKYFG